MAISIDWTTKIITVPRADMTLLQASPEIRELDLNSFRLELKSIEESEEGIPFEDTHRHNTEVNLSGIVYARIVEIINGYTVEFEDGQYTVSCTGANHNLADVRVANQVSLIVNNAAGLISNAAIEFSSFKEGVWIDATSSNTGTVFPTGTPQRPVNNLADAQLIANNRGLSRLYILGDFTFGSGDNIDNYEIWGQNELFSSITVTAGCSTDNTEFEECSITGTLSGRVLAINCRLEDVSGFVGIARRCTLAGTITLAGASTDLAEFLNCYLGTTEQALVNIDMGGDASALSMRAYSGGVNLLNKSGTAKAVIDLVSGRVELESTVTSGFILLRGVGELTANNATGITLNTVALVSPGSVADAVYDEALADHLSSGSFGEAIAAILGVVGQNVQWSNLTFDTNNNMTGARITSFTDNTLTTPRKSWDIVASYNSESELTSYQMTEV